MKLVPKKAEGEGGDEHVEAGRDRGQYDVLGQTQQRARARSIGVASAVGHQTVGPLEYVCDGGEQSEDCHVGYEDQEVLQV